MTDFSEDQKLALDEMNRWLDSPSARGFGDDDPFTLGGVAGSGKSFLVSHLVRERTDLSFACCAYTGKATSNLAKKLRDAGANPGSVTTIHGLIYRVADDAKGELKFVKRRYEELSCDVILVDEASMVSEDVLRDLKHFGKPILAVGDHFQLPPVSRDGASEPVLMKNPRVKLETIHRQAEGNPIIDLSRIVRERGVIPIPPPKGIRFIPFSKLADELAPIVTGDPEEACNTVVLTYMNATRIRVNKLCRELRHGPGVPSNEPRLGDLVVCLRNDPDTQTFNGMRGFITEKQPKSSILGLKFPAEETSCAGSPVLSQFDAEVAATRVEGRLVLDYGYAMTTHKAQGSGFERVYLVREKPGKVDPETFSRWCYTSVTRAISELVIVAK